MNWIITTQSETHTLGYEERNGAPLEVVVYGNIADVKDRMFDMVCRITPIGEQAQASCEDGKLIFAKYEDGDVRFSSIWGEWEDA